MNCVCLSGCIPFSIPSHTHLSVPRDAMPIFFFFTGQLLFVGVPCALMQFGHIPPQCKIKNASITIREWGRQRTKVKVQRQRTTKMWPPLLLCLSFFLFFLLVLPLLFPFLLFLHPPTFRILCSLLGFLVRSLSSLSSLSCLCLQSNPTCILHVFLISFARSLLFSFFLSFSSLSSFLPDYHFHLLTTALLSLSLSLLSVQLQYPSYPTLVLAPRYQTTNKPDLNNRTLD